MMESFLSRILDENNRVKRWPKKRLEQAQVLAYLQGKLESERKYSEPEINAIINAWHTFNDCALLRREMFTKLLIDRTPDGREYWLAVRVPV